MTGNLDIVRRADDPNVRRSDHPGVLDAFNNLRQPKSSSPVPTSYHLKDLLSDRTLASVLLSSNIFVFGKIGFLDLIFEALKSRFIRRKKKSIEIVRTQAEISKMAKENTNTPLILIPAAKNKEGVSEIVATAFETKRPIWLGALPSQIEKQILLSFDCFFISPGPQDEIKYLGDLTGLRNEHLESLTNDGITILTIDHNIPKIEKGTVDSPGKVFYIRGLA